MRIWRKWCDDDEEEARAPKVANYERAVAVLTAVGCTIFMLARRAIVCIYIYVYSGRARVRRRLLRSRGRPINALSA